MIGGLFRSTSRAAIVAAAGLFVGGIALSPAQAADLGGDCCADLEERVAELEATTVRHANRKISLTLSGQVNQTLLWYDNGEESDLYVIDNDEASTRLNMRGSGVISPGISAGFQIEVDLQMGNNFGPSENDGDDGDTFQFRRAEWWVKSDQLGTVTLGQGSMSSDGAFEVSFSNAWLGSVGYGLSTTNNGYFELFDSNSQTYLGVEWISVGSDFDTSRRNRVRYDSPTFAGFTLSASWGEDDEWDVTGRYANEFGGIRVAAAIAYHEDNDDGAGCAAAGTPPAGANVNGGNGDGCIEQTRLGGSIGFQHVATGLHIEGGYSQIEFDSHDQAAVPIGVRGTVDAEHWWVAAGIGFTVSSLGATDVTIQYIETTDQTLGFDYTGYGIGLGQDIDAIGAAAYISYNHHEADDNVNLGANIDAEFDQVTAGMRVRY